VCVCVCDLIISYSPKQCHIHPHLTLPLTEQIHILTNKQIENNVCDDDIKGAEVHQSS